jgi:RHS repeat-associated protein
VHLAHPHDGQALRRYLERYEYDAVGNFLKMIHQAANGSWTRAYAYEEPSLLEFAKTSNRLSRTSIGATTEPYSHDAHGNMTSMPHLPLMRWDFEDQLQATSQQVVNNGGTPEITYYVYDASGQRVRKVTERQAGPGQTPTRMKERIYLGGFELYREYAGDGQTVTLARETLHLMDDKQRIALVETRTQGSDPAPTQLIRYQLGNHLGSASLELDDQAQIISYEEYYPYGSTSYQAVRSQTETPKRYRYTGKERDEETGLYYHGARYYAVWVGRWVSCDPAGLVDGINVYSYTSNGPTVFIDRRGLEGKHPDEQVTVQPGKYAQELAQYAAKKNEEFNARLRAIDAIKKNATIILDAAAGPGAAVRLDPTVRAQLESLKQLTLRDTEWRGVALQDLNILQALATLAAKAKGYQTEKREITMSIDSLFRSGQGLHGSLRAVDISRYAGHFISQGSEQAWKETQQALLQLIRDLPPGEYAFGLPRNPAILPTDPKIEKDSTYPRYKGDYERSLPEDIPATPSSITPNARLQNLTPSPYSGEGSILPRVYRDARGNIHTTGDAGFNRIKDATVKKQLETARDEAAAKGTFIQALFVDQFFHIHLSVGRDANFNRW